MTTGLRWVLPTLAMWLTACSGSSVVGGANDAGSDVRAPDDLGVDGGFDAPTDLGVDAPVDVPVDAGRPPCTDDTCSADRHCDAVTNACVTGCRSDEGCRVVGVDGGAGGPSQRCGPAAHACVQCLNDSHCPAGNLCVGNLCVTGCNDRQACPTGQSCCRGACVDPQGNSAHCGGCDMRCALPGATAGCNNARCVVATCADGLGDCDRDPTNGCEVDVRAAVAHCGGCGLACPPRASATPSCAVGRCAYACNAGFADCDGDPTNGCEVDTRTTAAHCGSCAVACAAPNGVASCAAGACVVASCVTGFADCNASAADGCEADLRNAVAHCGSCDGACPPLAHTLATCSGGSCAYACSLGFGDCDGSRVDGCEVDLSASETGCGACGRTCVTANVAAARCVEARCQLTTCTAGFADCDGVASTGCEVDTRSSNADCGGCNLPCAAGTACTAGACRSTCAAGETFCAGRCVNTQTATTDCGGCGTSCPARPGATTTCASGACAFACTAGLADCNANVTDGCEVDTRTAVTHCGGCATACAVRAGATATCAGGACGFACTAGFADCDGSAANGCEVDTRSSVTDCGACGARCSLAGAATSACTAGACQVGTCAANRGDCNAVAGDGCESDLLTDASNCGACGVACGSGRACQGGVCTAFPSTGAAGPFDPTVNTVLPSGVYNFTTIRVRAGVTVTTSGEGVLDLRAQGDVDISGIVDLSGGRGGDGTVCNGAASGGGATGNSTAGISNDLRPDNSGSPGGSGGRGSVGSNGANATVACLGSGGANGGGGGGGWPVDGVTPGCGSGGGGGLAGGGGGGGGMCCNASLYGGRALYRGGAGAGAGGGAGGVPSAAGAGGAGGGAPYDGTDGASAGCDINGEGGGAGGSIGAGAASDLAMTTTFAPGSGGGAGGGGHGMGGGGAGGALRIATTTTLAVSGQVLANGGRGGNGTPGCCGAGGGGGSGGAIMLVAPTLRVTATGVVSAVGGAGGVASAPFGGAGGGGGLGRIALQARTGATTCTLAGMFSPALVTGCAATTGAGTRGRTYVTVVP